MGGRLDKWIVGGRRNWRNRNYLELKFIWILINWVKLITNILIKYYNYCLKYGWICCELSKKYLYIYFFSHFDEFMPWSEFMVVARQQKLVRKIGNKLSTHSFILFFIKLWKRKRWIPPPPIWPFTQVWRNQKRLKCVNLPDFDPRIGLIQFSIDFLFNANLANANSKFRHQRELIQRL